MTMKTFFGKTCIIQKLVSIGFYRNNFVSSFLERQFFEHNRARAVEIQKKLIDRLNHINIIYFKS